MAEAKFRKEEQEWQVCWKWNCTSYCLGKLYGCEAPIYSRAVLPFLGKEIKYCSRVLMSGSVQTEPQSGAVPPVQSWP